MIFKKQRDSCVKNYRFFFFKLKYWGNWVIKKIIIAISDMDKEGLDKM